MRIVLSYAAFAVIAGAGHAAEVINLNQALEIADRAHPQLQASAALTDAARAGIVTARARPNPEAGMLGGRQFARVPGATAGTDVFYTFSQPLELGPLRPARIALAERGVESSEFYREETRLIILSAVRRAFYEVLRRKAEIELAEQNLKLVESLRQRVQIRVNVGEAGTLELSRAEAEAATARTIANSARLQLISAMAQFRAAVGTPLDPDLTLEGSLERSPQLPSLDEVRKEALERHPTLRLARSEVRRSEARLGYETALRRPQPVLRTEVETLPDSPAVKVGIALPLNLWNRREGPIAEAAAGVRQATHLAEARQLEIVSALEGAYGRFQVASQQIASFEQGVLVEAEQALQGAETAYQLGERGIIEVLDAQRVLRGVRQDYLNAQYEQQAAQIDIDQLRAAELRRPIP